MNYDDVIVPDRENVIAMYHDHNIMMGPGKETVTDHCSHVLQIVPSEVGCGKNKFVLFSSSADTSRRTGNGTGNKTRLKNVSYF